MTTQPSPEFQIEFLQNIQRILKEGSFSSTYKFALLHSIADCCVELGVDDQSELTLTTYDLANKFIELYWSQTSTFPNGSKDDVLFQNAHRQAGIINKIHKAREIDSRLSIIKSHQSYSRLHENVAKSIMEMPLWRLQIVGQTVFDFMYPQIGKGNVIVLKSGVSFCFRKFYGHIVDMIHSAWIRWIQKASKNQTILGQNVNLEAFLFESKRSSLKQFVPILKEEQHNNCFYCGKQIRGEKEVDHFIPWSRYSVDLGHNFVLAHKSCNGDKRDHLAAMPYLDKWNVRNELSGSMLTSYFDNHQLPHNLDTSVAVASWAYTQCRDAKSLVWLGYMKGLVMI